MFLRANLRESGGLVRSMGAGDGFVANPILQTQATDSAQTLTVAQINSGIYIRSGMTAGRTDTTDTAVNILAAAPDMGVGDSYMFAISVTTAFALTLSGGVGVTLAGYTSVPASGMRWFVVTKTAATTVTITGL